MSTEPGEKVPFWVKCGACGHCWAPFYYPIDVAKLGRFGNVPCPMCGERKGIVAKQVHGKLLEPQQTGTP